MNDAYICREGEIEETALSTEEGGIGKELWQVFSC
jgi:hypothetical protein